MWLRQLLGYALLDYEDEHAIDSVGLLLPRQGTRPSWPVSELIAELSGEGAPEFRTLRVRFRRICETLRTDTDAVRGAREAAGAPPLVVSWPRARRRTRRGRHRRR